MWTCVHRKFFDHIWAVYQCVELYDWSMVAFGNHQLIVTNAGYPNDIPESLVPKAGSQSTRSFLERRIPTYVQLGSYPVAI